MTQIKKIEQVLEKLRKQIPELEQAKIELEKFNNGWEYEEELKKIDQLIDESKYQIARLTLYLKTTRN